MSGVYGYVKCPKCGGKAENVFESKPVCEHLVNCLDCGYIKHGVLAAAADEFDEEYADELESGAMTKTLSDGGVIYEGIQNRG